VSAQESRSPQRRRETRARLIDAAIAVFARQGYDAATVDGICEVAGFSKGAFYYHFSSKEAIFLELLHAHVRQEDPAGAGQETGADRGRDDRQAILSSLLIEFWAHALRNDRVREGLATLYEARLNAMLSRFGALAGSARIVEVCRALIALDDGLLLQQVAGFPETPGGREDFVRRLLEAYTRAAGGPPAPEESPTATPREPQE
jgi:AcrR family transcriptional regulator